MVTHGLVLRAADTRTRAAPKQSPDLQITARTHREKKRASCCDWNESRKYVTRIGMVQGVHDTGVFCPFLLADCSMWGLEKVLTKCNLPTHHPPQPAGYRGFTSVTFQQLHCGRSGRGWLPKQTFSRSEGNCFGIFKWNTSVSDPCWPFMSLPMPLLKIQGLGVCGWVRRPRRSVADRA